ncbi:MAG TPA: hypothetical protein VLO10_00465, partial [Candidatus Deferrimicrobium sp.]|nr:hypothetical protein [Candidatus Deferrimicrobium sp.]
FPIAQVARSLALDEAALLDRLDSIRQRLLASRGHRPAPARDDKVLTSWNALMITALADASAALGRADYLDSARRCADFLLAELRPQGVLLRTWKDGVAKIGGLLEDSAFLADALISLFEASGAGRYLAAAQQLVDDALERFGDGGVLYDTASDAEPLLVRPRTIDDNPIPAGQSVLASALLRLAALTGERGFRESAEAIMGPLAALVARSPLAISALACAMDRAQAPSREVAISGPVDDERTRRLVTTVHATWSPNIVLAWGDADVELLADRPLVDGRPAAYVCTSFACQRPVTEPEDLAALLG